MLHLVGYLYCWQMGFNSVFKGLISALDGDGWSAPCPNCCTPRKVSSSHGTQGWVGPRAGPDKYEKEKISCPHWGSNPTVQRVASGYTIYTIPPASHTEGAGMSMAHSGGKNQEYYTSHRFMILTPLLCSSILWFIHLYTFEITQSTKKIGIVESYIYI